MQKIIWQTHEWDYSDLPKHFLATSMTWKNLNPTWEYVYVNAIERAEAVRLFDRELYKMYQLCPLITQADIWRYVSVYQYGGAYADMDSVCLMPLDYLLETEYSGEEIMATELDSNGLINNANFLAKKNSIAIKSVIDTILAVYRDINYYQFFLEAETKSDFWRLIQDKLGTSPVEYTEGLLKHPNTISHSFKAAMHGMMFKQDFDIDLLIDYYGVSTSYKSLAKANNWTTYLSD